VLSATNTITSVKLKLKNDYTFFDYDSDALFVVDLTSVADDVRMISFYDKIGKTEYDRIALKDKVDLSQTEEYLYWAEVFTICLEFLQAKSAKSGQLYSSETGSKLTVEGYSYQTGSSEGSSEGDLSEGFYFERAYSYWKLAGFDIMSLQRTCSIFGEQDYNTFGRTIIE